MVIILRADRGFSLLLASERGAGWHSVQPAQHAPVAVAHAARGVDAGADGGSMRRHADAHAGAAGAGAAAPAQHPGGLPPGDAGRAHRARRAGASSAARLRATCRQRHPILLRV